MACGSALDEKIPVNIYNKREFNVLYESAMRLDEMKIVVVVRASDGQAEVVRKHLGNATAARLKGNAAVWTPEEMLRYVHMTRQERGVVRGLKQAWRSSMEFE